MEKWRRSGGEGVGRREEAVERGRRRGTEGETKGRKRYRVYNTCVSADIGHHSKPIKQFNLICCICLPTPTCFITFSRMLGRISLLENIVLMVGSTAFIATACRAMRSAWNPIKEEGREGREGREERGKREDIF